MFNHDLFTLQKLDVLFKLRVVDGCPGRSYLPTDVDMPLFTQTIDRYYNILTCSLMVAYV